MAIVTTPFPPVATEPTPAAPPVAPQRIVRVAGHTFGAPNFVIIAGPCSVSSIEQTLRDARAIKHAGAPLLRGGAFKPRSSPKSFQGFGKEGLEWLREAKLQTGLPIVTEVVDVRHLDDVLAVADLVQVGARNMHNTELLKELGTIDWPILLKRGLAATIDEMVNAVDYILAGGNDRVILCERGIRTFETAYRFTIDLLAVPILQERTGRPVIIDASHAPGRRDLVQRLSKAAVAMGADGLIVEVDEDPASALSDGPQQLYTADFPAYMAAVSRVASAEGRLVLRPLEVTAGCRGAMRQCGRSPGPQ
jgi:3-deoxy-7-phosphoheptulonate synthase